MNEFSTKEIFDNQIQNIWNDERFKEIDLIKRGYAIQKSNIKNSLLFVGINPSYDLDKDTSEILYYGYNHKYYKKFQEISKAVHLDWSHTDLLFIRETNQQIVENIIADDKNNGASFIYEQLLISKQIIEKCEPKILIVNNTLARKLLGKEKTEKFDKWLDFDFIFDNEIGTYRIIKNNKLENTPVFFTSMLTGQRALDVGSYERLIWHINLVNKTSP